ncbi:hypothetical protein PXW05_10440 [Serratia marcescens]|uniref:hypothetical protein n=1 Tax=Serratia marcescens TaxID=615 RepID=UPI0023AE8AED|nr:hypothetical protein [Serratia marcescens]WEE06802.1 hypothetical protein PXW05_10440 [Serratia marcescens]
MQAQETHFLGNGYTWNIPVAYHRREIVIPLLLAYAPGHKSKAYHKVILNGNVVSEASARGSLGPGGISYSGTDFQVWSGFIEANQAVAIQVTSETGDGGKTPSGVTVLIGNAG